MVKFRNDDIVALILAAFALIFIVWFFTGCTEYTQCPDRCGYKVDRVIDGECFCKVKNDWIRQPF